jgi:DNA-binding transcriptional MerR regulator
MYYSTREAARIMSEKGLQIEAATLRLYHKLGVFVGRKTSRGDLVYSTDDLVRLAPVIEARRAARLEALGRARLVADKARRDSQRHPVFA